MDVYTDRELIYALFGLTHFTNANIATQSKVIKAAPLKTHLISVNTPAR
jgi:hypothetical protein